MRNHAGSLMPPALPGSVLFTAAAPPVDMSGIDMSGLSAEQRARIAAVLDRQRAQAKAAGGAPQVKTRTQQSCVRADDLAAGKHSLFGERSKGDSHCQPKEVSRTPSKVTVRTDCGSVPGKSDRK